MYCQHISNHPTKQTVQPWFETMNLGGQKSFHKDPVGVPKDRRQGSSFPCNTSAWKNASQPALAKWPF